MRLPWAELQNKRPIVSPCTVRAHTLASGGWCPRGRSRCRVARSNRPGNCLASSRCHNLDSRLYPRLIQSSGLRPPSYRSMKSPGFSVTRSSTRSATWVRGAQARNPPEVPEHPQRQQIRCIGSVLTSHSRDSPPGARWPGSNRLPRPRITPASADAPPRRCTAGRMNRHSAAAQREWASGDVRQPPIRTRAGRFGVAGQSKHEKVAMPPEFLRRPRGIRHRVLPVRPLSADWNTASQLLGARPLHHFTRTDREDQFSRIRCASGNLSDTYQVETRRTQIPLPRSLGAGSRPPSPQAT